MQETICAVLATLEAKGRYMDRAVFEADMLDVAKRADLKILSPIKKAIFAALGERDPDAEICRDTKGRPEADSELRDTERHSVAARNGTPSAHGFRARQAQRSTD